MRASFPFEKWQELVGQIFLQCQRAQHPIDVGNNFINLDLNHPPPKFEEVLGQNATALSLHGVFWPS